LPYASERGDGIIGDFLPRRRDTGGLRALHIERIDIIFSYGITPTAGNVDVAGFPVFERGGNDTFKIAPITALNTTDDPSAYGALYTGGDGADPDFQWGSSSHEYSTIVFRADNGETDLRPSADVGSQTIHGTVFTYADLGISAGDTVYGYSLFGGDVNTDDHELLNPSGFPVDTSSSSNATGGLDLISSGTTVVPEPFSAVLLLLGLAALLSRGRQRP
jgi:hypothetical protein